MNPLILLVIFMMAVYICWNCRVTKSTIVLIVILGLAIYVMAYPGKEDFEETVFQPDQLEDAGLTRPSLFNCTSKIGRTAEQDQLYAIPTVDIK